MKPLHKPTSVQKACARNVLTAMLLVFTITACKKTPEYVLGQEEMASLMADIHTGEAVIDFNYSKFPNDSTRKMLKQSIYAAHGVTAETVDTSFVWYGNHIEEYIKVYDRTIEILKERQQDFASATSAQIAISGDSVAVWNGPQRVIVHEEMPSRVITFSLVPDSTWQNGDIYTLRYKPVNGLGDIESRLLVDYADGVTRYIDQPISTRQPNIMQIQVDSTMTPLRLYGYLAFSPSKNVAFEVDSISLTRQRKNLVNNYYGRPKTFRTSAAPEEEPDTTSTPTVDTNTPTTPRRPMSTDRRRPAAQDVQLPGVTWDGKKSEHRMDASQHKPTAKQRQEARERQRKNQPVKQRSVKPAPAKVQPAKK